jgi:hypothetical protein
MTQWYLIAGDDGAHRQVMSLEGENVDGKQVVELRRRGDLATEAVDLGTGRWVPNIEALRTAACCEIDAAREAAQTALMTPGTAKAIMYRQKAKELQHWRADPKLSAGLNASDAAALYPAAAAEAEAGGETIADVMARIGAAIDAINPTIYAIEANAMVAKRKVADRIARHTIRDVVDEFLGTLT